MCARALCGFPLRPQPEQSSLGLSRPTRVINPRGPWLSPTHAPHRGEPFSLRAVVRVLENAERKARGYTHQAKQNLSQIEGKGRRYKTSAPPAHAARLQAIASVLHACCVIGRLFTPPISELPPGEELTKLNLPSTQPPPWLFPWHMQKSTPPRGGSVRSPPTARPLVARSRHPPG